INVVAETPWGKLVPGEWLDEKHLVFHIDWKLTGLDPLDADVPALVSRPWMISGTTWTPSADETRQILTLLGAPTEAEIVSGGPLPDLEVTRFDIDGDTLHAGGESTL